MNSINKVEEKGKLIYVLVRSNFQETTTKTIKFVKNKLIKKAVEDEAGEEKKKERIKNKIERKGRESKASL